MLQIDNVLISSNLNEGWDLAFAVWAVCMFGQPFMLPCEQDPSKGDLQEKVSNPCLIEDVAPHSLGKRLLHTLSKVKALSDRRFERHSLDIERLRVA
jgi:hypothetical protein